MTPFDDRLKAIEDDIKLPFAARKPDVRWLLAQLKRHRKALERIEFMSRKNYGGGECGEVASEALSGEEGQG